MANHRKPDPFDVQELPQVSDEGLQGLRIDGLEQIETGIESIAAMNHSPVRSLGNDKNRNLLNSRIFLEAGNNSDTLFVGTDPIQ